MQCTCGGNAPMRTHHVDTLIGAQRWWPGATVHDLPLFVIQWECEGCGRNKIELRDRERRCIQQTDGRDQ